MTVRTAVAVQQPDTLRSVIETGTGHRFAVDDASGDTAPRPIEVVLGALATCTAMDVASILRKKRQPVSRYEVRATGEQRVQHPHAYERFELVHVFEGRDLDPAAIRRAIELSASRYCSVGANLATGIASIRHSYLIRDGLGGEQYERVIEIGPGETIESLTTITGEAPTALVG